MYQKNKFKVKIILCFIFAVSMAYLESAIVVYLRALHFPGGFQFPIPDIPFPILLTEIGRETATIIMIWVIAKMVANNRREWFAYFSFSFGMWDIWYYLWLKILLDWPNSLLDWDILFLIPFTWTGPVIAPIIVSGCLIISGLIILELETKKKYLKLSGYDWVSEFVAGAIIIFSFLEYPDMITNAAVPQYYPWWLFFLGLVLGLFVFGKNVIHTLKR